MDIARYTVNQARSIIRSSSSSARISTFTGHSDRRVVIAATQRLKRLPTVSPEITSLADRYGIPVTDVESLLRSKNGDLKALARSLAAKKARAARDLPKDLVDSGF